MKKTAIILLFILLTIPQIAMAKYSGGDGTASNPWKISTKADLLALGANTGDYGANFIMTNDIDLTGEVYTNAVIAAAISNTPTGLQGIAFSGVFDGNDFKIIGLTIDGPLDSSQNLIGLFGLVDGGDIRNLDLVGGQIKGFRVGGLVGHMKNSLSHIENCSTSAIINGDTSGGLVGENIDGTITACYATGTINGRIAGGLVGFNDDGQILNCYSTSAVTGGSFAAGGLVGCTLGDYNSIVNCYATGQVSGGSGSAGGFVGSGGKISNCYSTGKVSGSGTVGGFAGRGINCFNCFWDMNTSGCITCDVGRGLTSDQMKSIKTYQNAGWADNGWVINDGLDYPRLQWENTGGLPIPQPPSMPLLGSGSQDDPYQIWNVDDFTILFFRVGILDKHFKLMADLDLTGIVVYPIGDLKPFNGIFDGNNHVIHNIIINQPDRDYIGLFGYIDRGGTVLNLGLEDVNITGNNSVGGLAGNAWYCKFINNCYVTGNVKGNETVGGLAGAGYHISKCYSKCSVRGTSEVGGLVGCGLYISDCYSTGPVCGDVSVVGGLAGFGEHISNCYSISDVKGTSYTGGLVGTFHHYPPYISDSFWNVETQTHGISQSKGKNDGTITNVLALTTTQMQQKAIYTTAPANWDFINTWAIGENQTYPYLRQSPASDIDQDSKVDYKDLALLAENWLSGI